jgi:two-component system sensor histidine kinase CpxA
MKSLSVRIFVTFSIAFFFTSLVLGWTWMTMNQDGMRLVNQSTVMLTTTEAEYAYTTGGPAGLARFLNLTDGIFHGKRYFTDANGRDLVTGADLSWMKPTNYSPLWNAIIGFSHKHTDISPSLNNRYRLIVITPDPPKFDRLHLYIFIIPFVTMLLGWILSMSIVSPLLRVANTVERFGQGDLSARVQCNRKDEIGKLARSFNLVANRIEMLLTAERRLLQDVSHELRSPLMRLSFAAELMKNNSDPEAAAQRMHREISRLSSLVESLLEVAASEGDPAQRSFEHVQLAALVEEIVDDGRIESNARSIELTTEVHSSAIVFGNRELLRRAIENVLRNAIRFTETSSKVTLQVSDLRKEGTVIEIRDFGPGVPEEYLSRIFDPLFRVDGSRDRAVGGFGLGLSIARRAIQLHHGVIVAENAHPGLRIKITLPSFDEESVTTPGEIAPSSTATHAA